MEHTLPAPVPPIQSEANTSPCSPSLSLLFLILQVQLSSFSLPSLGNPGGWGDGGVEYFPNLPSLAQYVLFKSLLHNAFQFLHPLRSLVLIAAPIVFDFTHSSLLGSSVLLFSSLCFLWGCQEIDYLHLILCCA